MYITFICLQVVGSIKDNIREHELLDYLDSVFYHLPVSVHTAHDTKPNSSACMLSRIALGVREVLCLVSPHTRNVPCMHGHVPGAYASA